MLHIKWCGRRTPSTKPLGCVSWLIPDLIQDLRLFLFIISAISFMLLFCFLTALLAKSNIDRDAKMMRSNPIISKNAAKLVIRLKSSEYLINVSKSASGEGWLNPASRIINRPKKRITNPKRNIVADLKSSWVCKIRWVGGAGAVTAMIEPALKWERGDGSGDAKKNQLNGVVCKRTSIVPRPRQKGAFFYNFGL